MPTKKINQEKLFDILIKTAEDESFRQKVQSDPDLAKELEMTVEEVETLNKVLPQILNYEAIRKELEDVRRMISGTVDPLENSPAIAKEREKYMIEQLQTTGKLIIGFKEGLLDSVNQIKAGFRGVMIMYNIAFYVGILLIIASVVYAFISDNSLISIAFAGIGMIDIIIYFILKPPLDLQKSRANLAQLQSAYFNWLIDLSNWNSAAGSKEEVFQRYKEISEILIKNTEKTLQIIEDYCDLSTTSAKTPKES